MRDLSTGNRIMEGASPKTRMRSLTRKYILKRLQSDYLTFHQCSGISAAFGSLVILDVARCYLWLFTLYINIKISKNSC